MPSSTRRLFAFNTSNLPPTRMHAECIYRLGNEIKGEFSAFEGKEKETNISGQICPPMKGGQKSGGVKSWRCKTGESQFFGDEVRRR